MMRRSPIRYRLVLISALVSASLLGTGAGDLVPCGRGDVMTSAFNPNNFPVRITNLVLDTSQGEGGITVGAAFPGCPAEVFTFSPTTFETPDLVLSENSSTALCLEDRLSMSPSAPSACRGVAVTVHLAVVSA